MNNPSRRSHHVRPLFLKQATTARTLYCPRRRLHRFQGLLQPIILVALLFTLGGIGLPTRRMSVAQATATGQHCPTLGTYLILHIPMLLYPQNHNQTLLPTATVGQLILQGYNGCQGISHGIFTDTTFLPMPFGGPVPRPLSSSSSNQPQNAMDRLTTLPIRPQSCQTSVIIAHGTFAAADARPATISERVVVSATVTVRTTNLVTPTINGSGMRPDIIVPPAAPTFPCRVCPPCPPLCTARARQIACPAPPNSNGVPMIDDTVAVRSAGGTLYWSAQTPALLILSFPIKRRSGAPPPRSLLMPSSLTLRGYLRSSFLQPQATSGLATPGLATPGLVITAQPPIFATPTAQPTIGP